MSSGTSNSSSWSTSSPVSERTNGRRRVRGGCAVPNCCRRRRRAVPSALGARLAALRLRKPPPSPRFQGRISPAEALGHDRRCADEHKQQCPPQHSAAPRVMGHCVDSPQGRKKELRRGVGHPSQRQGTCPAKGTRVLFVPRARVPDAVARAIPTLAATRANGNWPETPPRGTQARCPPSSRGHRSVVTL